MGQVEMWGEMFNELSTAAGAENAEMTPRTLLCACSALFATLR